MEDTTLIKPGRWIWLWQLSKVRSWRQIFTQLKNLGFTGVMLHSDAASLARVITADILKIAEDCGVEIAASLAYDVGTSVYGTNAAGKRVLKKFTPPPAQRLADQTARVSDLICMDGVRRMNSLNAEMRWEPGAAYSKSRKPDARLIVDFLKSRAPQAIYAMPGWWKPSVHESFPTDIFMELCDIWHPQTYYVYFDEKLGRDVLVSPKGSLTPPEVLVEASRALYARRSIRKPLAWSFQATTSADAHKFYGRIFKNYHTTFWWHALRLLDPKNAAAARRFRALHLVESAYPGAYGGDAVRAFQHDRGLAEDALLGPITESEIIKALEH